jgi:hypothetical protein
MGGESETESKTMDGSLANALHIADVYVWRCASYGIEESLVYREQSDVEVPR